MFTLKVAASERSGDGGPSSSLPPESIEFSVGCQRVEHVTGVIHLYRKDIPCAEQDAVSSICALSVPADLGVQEFCRLCGPYLKSIRVMRFLRKENTRETDYMVFLAFESPQLAQDFMEEYSGKPFSTLESDIVWKLCYVDSLEFSEDPKPSTGETELPTCPVCLERLDENVSGVVVTVCNHIFHNECLMKWEDTSCPVCRHCMQGSSKSSCAKCGVTEDLWICLICGNVGCGRYKSKHAFDHWEETHHCYALELESQRVWDYVGDGYVHRLVQSKSGGKLVEVPMPGECSGARTSHQSGNDGEKVDYDRDEAIVASKIDAVAFEYNHLLSAQLESQRLYFENILHQNRLEAEAKLESLSAEMSEMSQTVEEAGDEAREACKQRKAAAKKASDLTSKIQKVEEEKEFLRQLNETLISNQCGWKTKTEKLEKELSTTVAEKDARIQELEEQVRDLIVFIEAQKAVGTEGEMQGGTLVAQEQETDHQATKQTRRRRAKR